jgi:hypothetical protein
MPPARRAAHEDARTELRAWYLKSLQPKLAQATAAGVARPGPVGELDRQLRAFLELPPTGELDAAA